MGARRTKTGMVWLKLDMAYPIDTPHARTFFRDLDPLLELEAVLGRLEVELL